MITSRNKTAIFNTRVLDDLPGRRYKLRSEKKGVLNFFTSDYPSGLLKFFADAERDSVRNGGFPHHGERRERFP